MSSGLFNPRDGLRRTFHAGRPRIKCNNASSSGWRARIHLSLTRVEAHDCVPGMRDDYFVRNASWHPYAKTGASERSSCACNNHHPQPRNLHLPFFLFSSSSFSLFRLVLLCRIRDQSIFLFFHPTFSFSSFFFFCLLEFRRRNVLTFLFVLPFLPFSPL